MKGNTPRSLPLLGAMIFGWLFPGTFQAQPTAISGTVNTYARVVSVDTVLQRITLSDATQAASFSLNEYVMLYQTKGAAVNQGDNASFGTISAIRGAGNMEMGRVCSVDGADVYLLHQLTQPYYDTLTHKTSIQLIKIPEYQDAVVTGTLTALPWDGQIGGVLAISVVDTLYVNGLIDASERGFRGAGVEIGDTCSWFPAANSYFYLNALGNQSGARKGEGIAVDLPGKTYGRGALANGGGGGNNHNAGGGGGGHVGAGGIGGVRGGTLGFFACKGNSPGIGGKALGAFGYSPAQQRAFMGGGGGAGQDNNTNSRDGGDGGGIVLIQANVITGTGSIRSNGGSVGDCGSDGAGGGGAGGSILLQANVINGAALTLEARGGNGGYTRINCEGPGGGGAGGVVWSTVPLGAATTLIGGGLPGYAQACANATQGATSGAVGQVITSGFSPPLGFNPNPCSLDPSLLLRSWQRGNRLYLAWDFDGENVQHWTLETLGSEGETWQAAGQFSGEIRSTDWTPRHRPHAFRVVGSYADGRTLLSNQLLLSDWTTEMPTIRVQTQTGGTMEVVLEGFETTSLVEVELLDLMGRSCWQAELLPTASNASLLLPGDGLAQGTYLLRARQSGRVYTARVLLQRP